MADWAAKRFWKDVTVHEEPEGFSVRLDGRPVRTPAKTPLVVPTRPMAEAVAGEWDAQDEKIEPLKMPTTRSANAALDKVAPQRQAVVEMIAAFGETDLLCYRAETPEALAERQAQAWDPLLDWADETFGARLTLVAGVMPVVQPAEATARLTRQMEGMSDFHLAAFHDLVGLTGSMVLGLAVAQAVRTPQEAWDLSRIDEDWQAEQWGRDAEAEAFAEQKRDSFLHAERFFRLAER